MTKLELRKPTQDQLVLAAKLGIDSKGKSYRYLKAEIADALDLINHHSNDHQSAPKPYSAPPSK